MDKDIVDMDSVEGKGPIGSSGTSGTTMSTTGIFHNLRNANASDPDNSLRSLEPEKKFLMAGLWLRSAKRTVAIALPSEISSRALTSEASFLANVTQLMGEPTGESATESSVGEMFSSLGPKATARFTTAPSLPGFMNSGKATEIANLRPVLYCLIISGILLALVTVVFLSVTLCTTTDCLWEASNLLENQNTSVNPCQDFFTYACGGFPSVHPAPEIFDYITVTSMVRDENDDKLKDSLERPVKDYSDTSAEKKLKILFQSCKDDFTVTKMGGKPLLDVIRGFGGWEAIYGSFNTHTWTKPKINQVLQSLLKLGVAPFLKIGVRADLAPFGGRATKYAVYLDTGSVGMPKKSVYLEDTDYTRAYIKAYQNYTAAFIRLLWKDAGITMSPEKADILLQKVTDDIIYVETQIANLTVSTRPIRNPAQVHKPMSYLDQNYPGTVQWSNLLSAYFSGATLQPSSIINLSEPDYIAGIANLINNLTVSQMNNYMMWRLAEKFYPDLGWEYVYIGRIWAMVKYDGNVIFVGSYNWCLIEIQRNLQQLLSSLFVQAHFVSTSGQQVSTIFGYLQNEALKRINTYTWMDANTKKEAKLKISNLRDMIGYPAWLQDNAQLNTFYSLLKIQKDAHFTNMMSVRQFQTHLATTRVINPAINFDEWPAAIYSPQIQYNSGRNRLYFPSGMLQHPIYNYRVPMVINFATMGRYIAENLIQALLYRCSDHKGASSCWWSSDSAKKFNNAFLCNSQPYANTTYCIGSPFSASTECLPLSNPFNFGYSNMKEVGAVNLAYSAYKSFVADNGPETVMAGLQSDSIDQAFFLGYAQTFCYTRLKLLMFIDYEVYGIPITEVLLDKVLSQMPAFGQAFNCPKNTAMTGTPKCPGF